MKFVWTRDEMFRLDRSARSRSHDLPPRDSLQVLQPICVSSVPIDCASIPVYSQLGTSTTQHVARSLPIKCRSVGHKGALLSLCEADSSWWLRCVGIIEVTEARQGVVATFLHDVNSSTRSSSSAPDTVDEDGRTWFCHSTFFHELR